MPVFRQLPDSKRRSRTGCLTCRSRRRKCDEAKPACRNCFSRGATCRYPDWTFVPDGPFPSPATDEPREAAVNVSRINVVPSPSIPSPQAERTTSPYHIGADENSSSHLPSSPPASTSGPTDALSLAAGDSRNDGGPITSWTSPHTHEYMAYEATTPSRWINGNLAQQDITNTGSALLRFRYQVIPWIDSNNGRSDFGPAMMTLARSNKAVSDCIFYCMRSRDESIDTPGSMSGNLDTRQRLLDRLSLQSALEANVGRALLATSDVFYIAPSEWTNHLAHSVRYCAEEITRTRKSEPVKEPLKTLLRSMLKIDLAVSIIANEPPSANIFLPSEDAITNEINLAIQSYDECLGCLANSLRLVHHELIPLLSRFHDPRPQSAGSHSSSWDRWSDLWMTCTLWFQARPRAMEPVLESQDAKDHRGEPFPIDLFTSTAALQANLVMHMSAVILLAHRPRLVDVAGMSNRLKSRSWHVHKIARMLVGNHFHEQWDPVVVAGLIFVAKEMSHVSQQNVILSCFREVARTTRVPMEREIASLREGWRLIYEQ